MHLISRFYFLSIFTFSAMINSCQAQTLKTLQWQNRLILVMADDTSNLNFKKQITHLTKNKEALTERKLIIYKVLPNQYSKGLEIVELKSSNDLNKKYNPKQKPFKVVLIGLDGRVKLEQTEIITIEQLKSIIDAMPMRKNEMRKNE